MKLLVEFAVAALAALVVLVLYLLFQESFTSSLSRYKRWRKR